MPKEKDFLPRETSKNKESSPKSPSDELLSYYESYLKHRDSLKSNAEIAHLEQMRHFGDNIFLIRKSLGLSNEDLALKLQIGPVKLKAIEKGFIPYSKFPRGFIDNLSAIFRDREEKNFQNENKPKGGEGGI